MTLKEFENLEIGDKYYLFMENTDNDLVSFTILDKVLNGFESLISLNQKTKIHRLTQHDDFYLSAESCYIEILKETIRKQRETESRNFRKIEENRKKLEDFKVKLNYNTLLKDYPEEFI